MKNDYILLNVFKDKGLLKGLIISLLAHFLLFTLFPIKKDKLLGDKYIPIEILDIKSPTTKGDSINESEKAIKKIFSNTENNFKQKSEEKLEKKIDNKKIDNFQKESKNKKIEESSIKKTTSRQTQLENDNKIRGIENGIKSNSQEAGSIKGKGYQKVTCLKCVEPKYPARALRRGAEGKPFVKVWINTLGKVIKSELIKSSGNESIDKAALLAADKSLFYPIKKDTTLTIEYEAKLRK